MQSVKEQFLKAVFSVVYDQVQDGEAGKRTAKDEETKS